MKRQIQNLCIILILAGGVLPACNSIDTDIPEFADNSKKQKMDFDIMVTRDGKVVTKSQMTKSTGVEMSEKYATMDKDIPFGLVAIDFDKHQLMLDNARVTSDAMGYAGYFDSNIWTGADKVTFSAYYPYASNLTYGSELTNYSIPFSTSATEAGPLVSRTVERAITQLNMVPLVFQHITNDIGYKICDVTEDPQLQGLIHLRKVTATAVASAGVYVNDLSSNSGVWHKQGYYRDVVVFEGDARVGVGSENEKFIGKDALVDKMSESHRYYSIPDEIQVAKQTVVVEYDVEGFEIDGFQYKPMKGLTAKYMLYGLLPDNVFAYGKQYTFHVGLDLSGVYRQVAFSAAVSDWETKIYENNDDF